MTKDVEHAISPEGKLALLGDKHVIGVFFKKPCAPDMTEARREFVRPRRDFEER